MEAALRRGLVAIRTVVLLGAVLAYLCFAFAQFPWTRGAVAQMVTFAMGPLRGDYGGAPWRRFRG